MPGLNKNHHRSKRLTRVAVIMAIAAISASAIGARKGDGAPESKIANDLRFVKPTMIEPVDAQSGSATQDVPTFANREMGGKWLSASALIGADAFDETGRRIAAIHDVILDPDGQAELFVLADGGPGDGKLFGLGSKFVVAAFTRAELKILGTDFYGVAVSWSEDDLKSAEPFDYDLGARAATDVVGLADGQVSLRQLIGLDVTSANKTEVGDLRDVLLSVDGQAMFALIGKGGLMGVGERVSAAPYSKILFKPETKALALRMSVEEFESLAGLNADER